jgi:putative transposase
MKKYKSQYLSASHHKYLCNYHINYHIILVCKYRKKLLQGKVNDDIQQIIHDYCTDRKVKIKALQSDIDHLHILIDCDTNIEPHKFVSYLKQNTTYHIWKLQKEVLVKHLSP